MDLVMIGSILDEFAAISHAFRRLNRTHSLGHSDVALNEWNRFHDQFADRIGATGLNVTRSGLATPGELSHLGNRLAVGFVQSLFEHGWARYRQKAYRDAMRVFGLCLVIMPENADAELLHASALSLAHSRANYLASARRSTVLNPLHVEGWKLTARGYFAAGTMSVAARHARHQLLLQPASLSGWMILARIQFRADEAVNALAHLRRATTVAPNDLDATLATARCQFRLDLFYAALSSHDKAAELGADRPEFKFERARIARAARRPDISGPLLDALEASDSDYVQLREVLELTASADDLRAPKP
jgi:tetratricopeptide (TPR) repeat protein